MPQPQLRSARRYRPPIVHHGAAPADKMGHTRPRQVSFLPFGHGRRPNLTRVGGIKPELSPDLCRTRAVCHPKIAARSRRNGPGSTYGAGTTCLTIPARSISTLRGRSFTP